jgi:hypothetical protein
LPLRLKLLARTVLALIAFNFIGRLIGRHIELVRASPFQMIPIDFPRHFRNAQKLACTKGLAVTVLPFLILIGAGECCGQIRPVLPFIAPSRRFEIAVTMDAMRLIALIRGFNGRCALVFLRL